MVRFANGRGHTLVGERVVGDVGAVTPVVVFAHGFMSDRASRGRFPRAAAALAAAGIGSLAFDMAGCGDSDDDVLTLNGAMDDIASALAFVGPGKRAVWGHSFGGLAAALLGPDVDALVLTGAPLGPMRYTWSDHFTADELEGLARTGTLTTSTTATGRVSAVSGTLLDTFALVDTAMLARRIKCPALLVCGDGDAEEAQVLAHARAALPLLPAGSALVHIAGAPHGFGAQFDDVIAAAVPWLATRWR